MPGKLQRRFADTRSLVAGHEQTVGTIPSPQAK